MTVVKNIEETIAFSDIANPELEKLIGANLPKHYVKNWNLLMKCIRHLTEKDYLNGNLQPVFFGSALKNFGVRELLDCFIEIAPTPRPKDSDSDGIA